MFVPTYSRCKVFLKWLIVQFKINVLGCENAVDLSFWSTQRYQNISSPILVAPASVAQC